MAAQLRNVQRLNILLFVVLFFVTMAWASTDGPSHDEVEIQKYLKKLNKPAVKSIKSPDGDIIDCVHILQQPAFDHPLLKGHKIQMSPEFHPQGLTYEENKMFSGSRSISQLWHKNGRCPEGTIPIRRTKKEDILRSGSPHQFGKKQPGSIPRPTPSKFQSQPISNPTSLHQHAIALVKGNKYYGTKVNINLWNPQPQFPSEFSLAQLWILGGDSSNLNTIEAGWQVYPQMYGDNNTRFFIYWTNDNYGPNGCYNHKCSGFVQTSSEVALGGTIGPISSYDGSQSCINILIWKDSNSNNWWMQVDKHTLGYWPGTLFPYLSDSASEIQWGGEIIDKELNGHTTTPMGSGHFPEEGLRKAAFISDIQVVDANNQLRVPEKLEPYATRDSCYNVQVGSTNSYFFFGGPGKNPNCP